MELALTITFAVTLTLTCVNWIIATLQSDPLDKILSVLSAIFFLLLSIMLQIVG